MDGEVKVGFSGLFGATGKWMIGLSVAAALSGCGRSVSLPYGNFMEGGTSQVDAGSSNAFTDYLSAASEMEANLKGHENLLHKSSFTPNEQTVIENAAVEPLKEVKAGLQKSCHIPYEPAGSKEAIQGRVALHLLSKVLIWRILKDCEAQSYESAIETAVLATKLGFDLSDGLPTDATLGLLTVDNARQAIASSLTEMTPEQLDLLAKSMKTIYVNRPSMDACFQAVEKDELAEVQQVQDDYRYEKYDVLTNQLGTASREIIPILKELHRQSDERRVTFFNGFAQQAKDDADLLKQHAALPVSERVTPTPPPATADRPWKKLAKRMLGAGKPLLAMSDSTDARTELLVLEAEIIRSRKTTGKTPDDLTKFSIKLSTDPYSGEPFIYRTDGSNYKLYSVGEDLTDNDGDTDETFTTPDLKLERHNQ